MVNYWQLATDEMFAAAMTLLENHSDVIVSVVQFVFISYVVFRLFFGTLRKATSYCSYRRRYR